MLSTKGFLSSGAAKEYYSHGDYYGSEGEGLWYGKGIDDLGLEGHFNAKTSKEFARVLEGYLPKGDRLGRQGHTGIEHRPGMDLTFSSPKSLSIEMLVNSNKQEKRKLENARLKALKQTLSFIEKEGYVFVRKGAQGIEKEKVHNLTFALFRHSTNRNNEPHDHVHCLLANMAKCSDGKYRSICWDNVFENNKNIGQYFRNFLALEVQKLGYDIRHINLGHKNGSSFELSKVSQELIDSFSTRRKEIEELYVKYNVTTSKGKDAIVINSRKAKQKLEEDSLKNAWKELSERIKQDNTNTSTNRYLSKQVLKDEQQKPESIVSQLIEKVANIFELPKKVETENPDQRYMDTVSVKDLVSLSIKDVSNYDSVFTKDELLVSACKYALGKYSPLQIQKEINKRIVKKELIIREDKLTVKELLQKERDILQFAKQGIKQSKFIINPTVVYELIKNYETKAGFSLNAQQVKAVKHVLTSEDKITAINGLPGVGKSTVLDAVRQISKEKVMHIGCSPTASAAKTLQLSSGIDSSTLHRFVGKYNGYTEGRGTKTGLEQIKQQYKNVLVIVDESSLIPTRMMWKLCKLSSTLGFRMVLVGDKNQLPAVEAGKPYEQMLKVIHSVELTQIMRQQNLSHRKAVIDSTRGEIDNTFKLHHSNIKEVGNGIVSNTLKEYFKLDQKERNSTLIISPSRLLRDKINNKIVEKLNKTSQVTGNKITVDILKQKDMSISDYSFANSYNSGDVVKFYKAFKRIGIEQGDYLTIESINTKSNSIVFLKNAKPVRFELKATTNYKDKLEAFEKAELILQEGIKIRITQNDQKHGLINSESAFIESINKNAVTLKLENQDIKTISLKDLRHIDYGYCTTVHSAQGKTEERILGAITADNKHLNSQKLWTVFLSRHKNEITCIVDDSAKLKSNIQKNTGSQISSLEFANEQIISKKTFSMRR